MFVAMADRAPDSPKVRLPPSLFACNSSNEYGLRPVSVCLVDSRYSPSQGSRQK